MSRIFGKFADGDGVRTGIIEHKNGVITKVTPAVTSPFKTHRYDPKSYVIFPGFVDPYVLCNENKKANKDKHLESGFTHVRHIPCGSLKAIGDVARIREARGKQYVADMSNNYSEYSLADMNKLLEAFSNSHNVHCTFAPELQSSLERYATNKSNATRHPPVCEAEGIDILLPLCEKYWVKAAILISTYTSLKKMFGSFKRGFVFYPLICIRHLVDVIDSATDDIKPALRDVATRDTLLKNAFVMNTTILTMMSDIDGLKDFATYVLKLIELGVSLKDIANATSLLPNEYLGRSDYGKIKEGYAADFTVLGNDGAAVAYVGGELCK